MTQSQLPTAHGPLPTFLSSLRTSACLCGCLLVLCACNGRGRDAPPRQPIYTGPTESLQQVVDAVNANNQHVPSLWARHYYEATVVDERGRRHFVNGDGVMLHLKPRDLRILGSKDIAGTIFEIGSTDEQFWLKLVPEMDTMWWGHYRNLGKPCMQPIPIRPDLVLEVLGVGRIDTNFLQEPVPVMRFNNDADAYMFVWQMRGPDRWIAQKEVWYDRATKLPRLVLLFDTEGRIVLRAYLLKHRPIDVPGLTSDQRPRVATDYRLFFPENGTRMSFELRDIMLTKNNVPRAGSIRFPREPGVNNVVQIDVDCP